MEGSTLLVGSGSGESRGVHMSRGIAWEDGPRTFPGGLLGRRSWLASRQVQLGQLGGKSLPEVSARPTALFTDSTTVIMASVTRVERWRRGERRVQLRYMRTGPSV